MSPLRCYPAGRQTAKLRSVIRWLSVRDRALQAESRLFSHSTSVPSFLRVTLEAHSICANMVQGITSWGGDPCAYPRTPSVYTKVSVYVKWIKANIKNNP